MRIVVAHFICDRCKAETKVEVPDEQGFGSPEQPAHWLTVRGPANVNNSPDKLLCPNCVCAWRQFFQREDPVSQAARMVETPVQDELDRDTERLRRGVRE